MPYLIRKLPNKDLYRVRNSETGKIHSYGTTLTKAKQQIRLLESIKKPKPKSNNKLPPVKKVRIYGKNIPERYIPSYLTSEQKRRQARSIIEKRDRPRLKNIPNKKSSWTMKAHMYFGKGNTSPKSIAKQLGVKLEGFEKILSKGRGAYYSGGSRPNQTPESWARARLFSVLFGGKARIVDKKIVNEYRIPLLKLK